MHITMFNISTLNTTRSSISYQFWISEINNLYKFNENEIISNETGRIPCKYCHFLMIVCMTIIILYAIDYFGVLYNPIRNSTVNFWKIETSEMIVASPKLFVILHERTAWTTR